MLPPPVDQWNSVTPLVGLCVMPPVCAYTCTCDKQKRGPTADNQTLDAAALWYVPQPLGYQGSPSLLYSAFYIIYICLLLQSTL